MSINRVLPTDHLLHGRLGFGNAVWWIEGFRLLEPFRDGLSEG